MTLITLLASQKILFSENKKGILFSFSTLCFVAYLAVGGLCFWLLEGPQIEKANEEVWNVKAKIMNKYPDVPAEAFDDFLSELQSLGIRGIKSPNKTAKFSFADSVFFCATLVTTIGYGHITPSTDLGKAICIAYTALGIPVTLVMLAAYVQKMINLSEAYKASLFHKLGRLVKPVYIRLTHVTTILVLILLFCFILPSVFFSFYETGWSMFHAIYFCFISLTTVGLGDFVPALNPNSPYTELYKYGATFYIIAGLTVMMFMMAMTADFIHNYDCRYEDPLPFTNPNQMKFQKQHFTRPHHKISINEAKMKSYGAIIVPTHKSEESNKPLMPP
ncbi:potassium channel subfamily K member 6-like [Uloborus diversus]|uniref:potassium channel subfamily K member 6-like n=1 Tax=Uloborus diversus TaxID=327109 RepID=UPI002409A1E8|nr:potassium channel subfamily K member 6-like [Uloborus diversus]XP_054723698.1 potassium channel subfamily K member 6-like [Uloborus diversus]